MDATVVRLWVSNLCIFTLELGNSGEEKRSADRNENSWNLSTYTREKLT